MKINRNRSIQTYAKHRPKAMDTPDSPFYIVVNQNSIGGKWFKNQPVGRDKLGVMMKTMARNAGLTGKKTNQSLRKTLCTNSSIPALLPLQYYATVWSQKKRKQR